jgi:hypothetical protein
MSFDVGSNFAHHAADPSGGMSRRLYINSADYSRHVDKWPTIKRDWNSIRSTTVAIGLENTSQIFNFFHTDKTRLKDTVDIDYGVRYRSHNLLTYSHIFSATDWAKINGTIETDAVANPINQEVDADKFFVDTSVNSHGYVEQSFVKRLPFETADYWAVIRSKPSESLAFQFEIDNGGVTPSAIVDVQSGSFLGTPSSNFIDRFVRQNTNGWYDIGVKFTSAGSDDIGVRAYLTNPSSKQQIAFTGNGSDGMYFHGANVQEAQYFESHRYFMTEAARQEPWGMNLWKWTENFSASAWGKSAGLGLTLDTQVAPDGNTTMDTVVDSSGVDSLILTNTYAFTEAEQYENNFYCHSKYFKEGTAEKTMMLLALKDTSSAGQYLQHQLEYEWAVSSVTGNTQVRATANSGTAFISNAGVVDLDNGLKRFWITMKSPGVLTNLPALRINQLEYELYPASNVAANSGSVHIWGAGLEIGGPELLDGPGPYVPVASDTNIYPTNAEDMIGVFDGTIRDANFSKGKLRLQAKDKLRQLSERTVGTGEVPVSINSITPSWLAFTLCSCYGGMDAVQSTNNVDIHWAAVDSWDSYNGANTVHVKADLRGIKITEALKRIARMTRVAMYIEEDRITFRRWTNVATQIETLDNDSIRDIQLSVNDENLVNKQWIFGDWDQASEYYKISLFDEDTASQNSFGLHEKVIRDQAIFYTGSAAMLDTAQRIIASESEPIDRIGIQSIPHALRMQTGESISVNDPELNVAGTFRIMSQQIDMNKNLISFGIDNSQLILGNPFILDTSSLSGTDILS